MKNYKIPMIYQWPVKNHLDTKLNNRLTCLQYNMNFILGFTTLGFNITHLLLINLFHPLTVTLIM